MRPDAPKVKVEISKDKIIVDGQDDTSRVLYFQFEGSAQGTILTLTCVMKDQKGKVVEDGMGPVTYVLRFPNPDVTLHHDGSFNSPKEGPSHVNSN